MEQWQIFSRVTLNHGKPSGDRTGNGVIRRFGDMIRYNLLKGFPMVTSKYTNFQAIAVELLWFLLGSSSIRFLKEHGVTIWDEWVDPKTAKVEFLSVEKMIQRTLKMVPDWNLDFAMAEMEVLFFERFGKLPLYVAGLTSGFDNETRKEVAVGHLTGDDYKDKLTRLEKLVGVLSDTCHRNEIITRGNFYGYNHYRDWLKKIADLQCEGELWPIRVVDGDVGPLYPVQWRNWPVSHSFRAQKAIFNDFLQYGFEGDSLAQLVEAYQKHLDFMHENVKGHDQIAGVIKTLRNNPESRRIMVNAWNVGELERMQLPPCHYGFQLFSEELTEQERYEAACYHLVDFYEDYQGQIWDENHGCEKISLTEFMDNYGVPKRGLKLMFNQRSVDTALGSPFNIASYALLCHMIAQVTDHMPTEVIHACGDIHIYNNHIKGMKEVVERPTHRLPRLVLNRKVKEIDDFKISDIELHGYIHEPYVHFEVAV